MAGNGGIIGPTNTTSFGKNKVTSKTSTGTITTQTGTRFVDYIVVAGGAGGGGGYGGGGGAGGFRSGSSVSVSGGETLTATVGGAGAASTGSYASGSAGGTGGNSILTGAPTICAVTSAGGGGGGTWNSNRCGVNGGSAGGSSLAGCGGTGNTPPTSPPQGKDGGKAGSGPDNTGGGGGAGAAGACGSCGAGGAGGVGVDTSANVTLTVDKNTPEILYYKLDPVYESSLPAIKEEIVIDTEVIANSEVQLNDSIYNGKQTITVPTSTSFTYTLGESPERVSYADTTASSGPVLSYETDSSSALGPITKFDIFNIGRNYYELPGIATIRTASGGGADIKLSSNSLGGIRKIEINDIGFDYASDITLNPNIGLPQNAQIIPLTSIKSIGITSVVVLILRSSFF